MSEKAKFLRAMLRGKRIAYLHVDSRDPDVVLPFHLLGKVGVKLGLTQNMDVLVPITDLLITDNAVSATLSFALEPFHCVIPWSAVVAVTNEAENFGKYWGDELSGLLSQPLLHPSERPYLRLVRS